MDKEKAGKAKRVKATGIKKAKAPSVKPKSAAVKAATKKTGRAKTVKDKAPRAASKPGPRAKPRLRSASAAKTRPEKAVSPGKRARQKAAAPPKRVKAKRPEAPSVVKPAGADVVRAAPVQADARAQGGVKPQVAPPAAKSAVETKRPVEKIARPSPKEIEAGFPIIVKDLSIRLNQKPSVVIKALMAKGVLANINRPLSEELAVGIAADFGFTLKKALSKEERIIRSHRQEAQGASLSPRAAVVTFMGHVDHGKTSLLDIIRKSKVAEREHGGITQHIGAYMVSLPRGKITFLDTPGHEAFTAMRSRGARITDIVVLVVAADDGLMPQTREAIDHARAADVPIVVAINKIDKPGADMDKVKRQLSELDLVAEDWGGKTITVGVSAKTGEGIDSLLEMILLEAEMLELKADFHKPAAGIVIDAKLSRGRGAVATVLVQAGTLHIQDAFICGKFYGRIKAMFNDRGDSVRRAFPSMPVEIIGISGVPAPGEQFYAVSDERQARDVALSRQEKERFAKMQPQAKRLSLEDISSQIKQGKIKELAVIIKADVQGSLGALEDSLGRFSGSEVKMRVIHKGIGNINTSDALLASASGAVLIGFHVNIDDNARDIIRRENLDVRTYTVIYEAIREVKAALEGLLEPKIKRLPLGSLAVRRVFNLSKGGLIAGCYVEKGRVVRNCLADVIRGGEVIFTGKVVSLKRFKDDARAVEKGLECGVALADFKDYRAEDTIEAYEIEKVARTL
ncbi:MAG: translation initiation factor IF-2 [Candidatus Omnitrophota bacterium]